MEKHIVIIWILINNVHMINNVNMEHVLIVKLEILEYVTHKHMDSFVKMIINVQKI